MERTLRNSNMKPLSHSSYLRLQILCKSFYDVDKKLSSLNDISLSDLRAFIPELRSQVHMVFGFWQVLHMIVCFHQLKFLLIG